jgi:hypothetical protein
MSRFAGPPCPQDREHGVLFDLPSGRWYCPYAGHVGEPFYTYEQLLPPWGSAAEQQAEEPRRPRRRKQSQP